jgi:biopolymer transport protein ExbB/TolQ
MFGGISSYIMMGMLLTILLMVGAGYWYFSYSQREIGVLRENAAKLEQAVQTQQQTIQAQQEAHERSNQEVLNLQNRVSGAERTRRDLEVRLRQQNLEAQARVRRQDTERDVNTQMQSQLQAFERLSGFVGATPAATTSTTPATPPSNTRSRSSTPSASDPQPPPRPPVRGTAP